MKQIIKYAGMFLLGSSTGALAYHFFLAKKLEKKYDAQIEKEIEYTRDLLKQKIMADQFNAEEYTAESEVTVSVDTAAGRDYTVEYSEREKRNSEAHPITYDDYITPEGPSEDFPRIMTKDGIELVSFEVVEHDEYNHYDAQTWVYYPDHIIADEEDNIIDDWDATIGPDALSHWGWESRDPDTVFIINHNLGMVIELIRFEKTYREMVMGSNEGDVIG